MSDVFLYLINLMSTILWIALLGRVLSSWFNVTPQSPFYSVIMILYQVTEPILAPIRRVLPKMGMLDLSPLVALLLISFIQRIVIAALR